MADALNDLNKMIERIRRDADAEGYARAMREVAAFVAGKTTAPLGRVETSFSPATVETTREALDQHRLEAGRAPRGRNKARVSEMLKGASIPMSIQQIKDGMESKYGETFPYSSIQYALNQIERDGYAESVGRGIFRWKDGSSVP